MEYGATTGVHISTANCATVTVTANCTINGNGSVNFQALNSTAIICRNRTITLTGTPAFSSRFAYAFMVGTLHSEGNTFAGAAATGIRYKADATGVIFTGGGGANYSPGNAAGSVTNGGNYV